MRKIRALFAAGLVALSCTAAMANGLSALSSMETQVAAAANTPYPIQMTGEASSSVKVEGSKIIAVRAGDFYFNAAIQVGGTGTGEVYVWMRLNGKDMDDSNSIQSIPLKGFTAVLVVQTGLSLKKGDVVELFYAATAPGLGAVATKPKNMPGVPALIVSIFDL